MLTYAAFIDELRALVPRGKALSGSVSLSESEPFKRWRLETVHLIESIQNQRYRIKSGIQIRRFNIKGFYEPVSDKVKRERFETDLKDTIAELEVLISSFDKFGDPNNKPEPEPVLSSETTTPLVPPEKYTLAWLWQHGSLKLWLTVIALAGAILTAGIALGRSALYDEIVLKLQPLKPAASSVRK